MAAEAKIKQLVVDKKIKIYTNLSFLSVAVPLYQAMLCEYLSFS